MAAYIMSGYIECGRPLQIAKGDLKCWYVLGAHVGCKLAINSHIVLNVGYHCCLSLESHGSHVPAIGRFPL